LPAEAPVSLSQYLGTLRGFVDTLHSEAVTVASHVKRLEGRDREQAFGWEMLLERARHRAALAVEHWLDYNRRLDGRVYPDDIELPAYGEHHHLRHRYGATCAGASELLGRIGRHVEGVDRFDSGDVKLVAALVGELLDLLREEATATREVARRLVATATEEPEAGQPYPFLSRNQAREYLDQYAAARRAFEEELQKAEAA
jgi:hypothetical protein